MEFACYGAYQPTCNTCNTLAKALQRSYDDKTNEVYMHDTNVDWDELVQAAPVTKRNDWIWTRRTFFWYRTQLIHYQLLADIARHVCNEHAKV